jgi:polyferredoxin
MECTGCTACIDACNKMMIAIGRPKGLVRYASEAGIAEGKKLRYTGRMKFYSALLIALAGILALLLATRDDVGSTIVRAPGQLYQERGEDSISNLYIIKVVNKTLKDIPLTLRLENAPGRIIETEAKTVFVKKEDIGKGSFFIVLPKSFVRKRKTALRIALYNGDKRISTAKTNFMGPFTRF